MTQFAREKRPFARLRWTAAAIALTAFGAAPTLSFAQDAQSAMAQGEKPADIQSKKSAGQSQVAQAAPADKAQTAEAAVPEIVITGSHIARSAVETLTPVVTVTGQEIQARGITNAADVLNQLPQLGIPGITGTTSNFLEDAAGLELVNLRNLGVNRTLTLIDSRRTVGGSPQNGGAVDISTIPTIMIDRVDVVTGGGSAAYGSEAVAGVINIKLRDHVEGIEFNQQYGLSQYGDDKTSTTSILAGTAFAHDRGHVVTALEYMDQGQVMSKDRGFSANDVNNGLQFSPSTLSRYGNFGTSAGNVVVLSDGSIAPYNKNLYGFNREQYRTIAVPLTRFAFVNKLTYDVADDVAFFMDTRFNRTDSTAALEPIGINTTTTVGTQGATLFVPGNNPYIPASLAPTLSLDANGNLADFRRRLFETGLRGGESQRYNYSVVSGFTGNLLGKYDWTVYYSFGRTSSNTTNAGLNVANLQEALVANVDVTPGSPTLGQIVCTSATARAAGCVPVNIFGPGTISKAALNYIAGTTTYDDSLDQNVVSGNITGPVVALPYGDLVMSLGGEYRREHVTQQPDALTQSGLSSNTQIAPFSGGYDIKEVFAEAKIPILKDLPFVKSLEIDLSDRYGYYSSVGITNSTNYGLTYAPTQDIQFRASNAVAIRAPNIQELYQAPTQSFNSVNDPCSDVGLASAPNPATRAAKCATIPGITPGFHEVQLNQQSEISIQSGNANLNAERGRVLTFGTSVTPRWIPGFSGTVDFFKYNIENAVNAIGLQTAADQCIDTGNPQYCSLVRRNPTTGLILGVDSKLVNVGEYREHGFDVGLNYNFDVADAFSAIGLSGNPTGKVVMSWDWQHLVDLNFTSTNDVVTYQGGLMGAPKNRWTYNLGYFDGPLTLNYQMRYVGSQSFDGGNGGPSFGPVTYSDFSVRYKVTDNIAPYVGVRNLFNQKPQAVDQNFQQGGGNGVSTATTGTNTYADVYDVIGRFVYAGVNVKF